MEIWEGFREITKEEAIILWHENVTEIFGLDDEGYESLIEEESQLNNWDVFVIHREKKIWLNSSLKVCFIGFDKDIDIKSFNCKEFSFSERKNNELIKNNFRKCNREEFIKIVGRQI